MSELEQRFGAILDDCNANGIEGRDFKALVTGLWFSPAVRILLSHRFQKRLKQEGGAFRIGLARILWARSVSKWGCDIGNQAEIDPGVTIPHTVGVVIGNFVKIEKGCKIFQGVTLGDSHGQTPGRPTIKEGATLYARSTILGDITVGKKAVIGAHSLVMENVPDKAVVRADQKKSKKKKAA